MRISFMTFACPAWSLDEVLRVGRRLGYDGVEPRLDSGHAHGIEVGLSPDGRERAKAQFAEAGVAVCCLATSLGFIATESERRTALLEATRARLELAADLGCPGLRVFAGGVPQGVSLDEALDAAADNLRAAGDIAAALGVELWLETHDTVSCAELCARVVRAADHPSVWVNYDVMHPLRCGEPLDTTFAALDGLVRHAHWHDAILDPKNVAITRFGEGEMPLGTIVEWLRGQGFEGYLSGEWFEQQLGADSDDSLEHYAVATRDLLS